MICAISDNGSGRSTRFGLMNLAGLFASFAGGAITVLAMAPYDVWACLFAGLATLYVSIACAGTCGSAFVRGWLFGFGYFLFGLSWIGNALLVDGNPYKWAWPLAVVCLPALLAFFPAVSCYAAKRTASLMGFPGLCVFVAALSLSEWLRGHVMTGFPWNLYGYSWTGALPVAQTVSLGGIYFLTLLTVFWGSLPGFAVVTRGESGRLAVAICFLGFLTLAGACVFGVWRLGHYPSEARTDIDLLIVQPNIPQSEKWDIAEMDGQFRRMTALSVPSPDFSTEARRHFIVWPETAISFYLMEHTDAPEAMKAFLQSWSGDAFLMTGFLRRERNETGTFSYYNSLVVFNREGQPESVQDKFHLVPFGEYIPFQKWIPLDPVVKFNGFRTGPGPSTLFPAGLGISISPVICYEIIFPGQIAGPQRPDLIVNVTNDGWYGESAGPYQHFSQAVFRAMEEGVPVVRSANTGISGLIDPLGRIEISSSLGQERALHVPLAKPLKSPTLFKRIGDSLFWLCFSALLCPVAYANVRKRIQRGI